MADLDTRNKRGSALGIDNPFLRIYSDPDGTVGQADRQQAAMKYSGILASNPGGFVPTMYYYHMIGGVSV